jgi:hypothetical protein
MALSRGYQILAVISIAATMLSSLGQFPPESTLPPAPACPSPDVDTKSWQIVTLNDCRIRLKLPNANPVQNKTIRQKDYEGFTECNEVMGGREAIIQSFRGRDHHQWRSTFSDILR